MDGVITATALGLERMEAEEESKEAEVDRRTLLHNAEKYALYSQVRTHAYLPACLPACPPACPPACLTPSWSPAHGRRRVQREGGTHAPAQGRVADKIQRVSLEAILCQLLLRRAEAVAVPTAVPRLLVPCDFHCRTCLPHHAEIQRRQLGALWKTPALFSASFTFCPEPVLAN